MNKYDGVDSRIVSNVKMFAKYLKRKTIFRSIELDDIEQDLMCEVFSCISNFNANCGDLEHFIRKVLKDYSVNLQKSYSRKKRITENKSLAYTEKNQNDETDNAFKSYQILLERHIEISHFMDEMPIKHRLIYSLLANHSIIDISRMICVPRSAVSRAIGQIIQQFNYSRNSKDKFLVNNYRRKLMGKNLSVIEILDVKKLSKLEVYDLADLSEQVAKLLSHAKELKEKLDDALNLRFSETIKENLRSENKDTGTTKFIENGFQIVAEVPKKVTWDSQKMEEIIKVIPEAYRRDCIKTTYSIAPIGFRKSKVQKRRQNFQAC